MFNQSYLDDYTEIILDGISFGDRCVLVAFGKKEGGKKEFIDLMLPSHENEKDWKLFLEHLKKGGLNGKQLKKIQSDGEQGVKEAVATFFPSIQHEVSKEIHLSKWPIFYYLHLSMKNPKKLRLFLGWILALMGLWLGRVSEISLVSLGVGLFFIGMGQTLRLWASGTIIKTKELTTHGPYALTRNPLYLGSFFIGSGFFILGQAYWMLIVLGFLFWMTYRQTVLKEEEELKKHFGHPFEVYQKNVPRIFPHFKNLTVPLFSSWKFSWKRCYENGEIISLCLVVLAVELLLLRSFFIQKQTLLFECSSITAVVTALLLGFVYLKRKGGRKVHEFVNS